MANRKGNRMTAVITGLAGLMLKRSEAGKATCGGPHFAAGGQKSGKADDRSDADSSPFPNEPCRQGSALRDGLSVRRSMPCLSAGILPLRGDHWTAGLLDVHRDLLCPLYVDSGPPLRVDLRRSVTGDD